MKPRGVADALLRLADAGFEMRVIIGKNKHGNPVFATNGHSTDYKVPLFPQSPRHGGAIGAPEGHATAGALGAKGHARASQRSRRSVTPDSHLPSDDLSSDARDDDETVIIAVFQERGEELDRDEAARVIEQLHKRSKSRIGVLDSYARRAITKDPDHWLQVARDRPPSFDDRQECAPETYGGNGTGSCSVCSLPMGYTDAESGHHYWCDTTEGTTP